MHECKKKKKKGGLGGWWGTVITRENFRVFFFNSTSIMLGQMLKSQKFKNDRQKKIFFI